MSLTETLTEDVKPTLLNKHEIEHLDTVLLMASLVSFRGSTFHWRVKNVRLFQINQFCTI